MTPNTKLPKPKPPIFFAKQFSKDWKYLKHDKFRQKFLDLLIDFEINPMDEKFRNHELRSLTPKSYNYPNLWNKCLSNTVNEVRTVFVEMKECVIIPKLA